jgi:type VI secretion system secreted protein Hcp
MFKSKWFAPIIIVMAASLSLAGVRPAFAVDYFLKLDGIDGESQDAQHKGEIEVLSWSWGASQVSSGSGAHSASRPCSQDISFTKYFDKASPRLMSAVVMGTLIPKAVLTARKSGSQQQFLKFELTNVMVTSYHTGGSGGDVLPTEQISMQFQTFVVEYTPQLPGGGSGDPVRSTINGGC